MYKGQIKDFPKEVVDKMLEYQVAQGNPKDVSVFEINKIACINGFNWKETEEGGSFWDNVIINHNFESFFKEYPKSETKLDETKQSEQYFEIGQTVYSHLFPEGEGIVEDMGSPLESFLKIRFKNSSTYLYFTSDGKFRITGGIVISQTPLEPIKNKVIEKCPFEKGEWVAVRDEDENNWMVVQFETINNKTDYKYRAVNGGCWKQCKKLSEFNI